MNDKIKIFSIQNMFYQITFSYHNITYYINTMYQFKYKNNNYNYYIMSKEDTNASNIYCNDILSKNPKIKKMVNLFKLGLLKKGMEI